MIDYDVIEFKKVSIAVQSTGFNLSFSSTVVFVESSTHFQNNFFCSSESKIW